MKPIALRSIYALAGLVLACLALGSCAASMWDPLGPRRTPKPQALASAEEVYAQTTIEWDRYKASTLVRSPLLNRASLQAVESDKSGERLVALMVGAIGTEWSYLDSAGDTDGNKFTVRFSRKVENWSGLIVCAEHVTVELPEGYLEARRTSGLSIKLWGSAGEWITEIPACYVEGFCRRLAELPGKQGAPVASAASN